MNRFLPYLCCERLRAMFAAIHEFDSFVCVMTYVANEVIPELVMEDFITSFEESNDIRRSIVYSCVERN